MSVELTMDEQLTAFLEQWEAVRAALVKKYELRAATDKVRYGANSICYESSMRSLRHYQHEAAMLAELRARSWGVAV